jgi:modulator of FtsH protease HflK
VETARRLQEVLDRYDSGVRIEGVELLRVVPPEPVREAIDDLPRASQEKETLLRQARGREEEIIAEARDDAESMIEAAQAARPARLVQAQAEAERFVSLLRQYEQETDPARRELYLEVMEEQLPGIARFIDSSGTAP